MQSFGVAMRTVGGGRSVLIDRSLIHTHTAIPALHTHTGLGEHIGSTRGNGVCLSRCGACKGEIEPEPSAVCCRPYSDIVCGVRCFVAHGVFFTRIRPFRCLSVYLMTVYSERSMQEAFKGEYVSLHVRRSNYAAFHLYTQTLGYSYVVCREWRGCGLCGRFSVVMVRALCLVPNMCV